MIYSLTVTNYLGETIKMDLADPLNSGFAIKKIEGLGPGKADINTTDIATTDGSLYNSARMNKRNIVLNLIFMATDIEAQRQMSYKYFPIKKELTLEFQTDHRRAKISGYVESNEPDIFSKQESSKISIICPDPYFISVSDDEEGVTTFSGTEPAFEFLIDSQTLEPIPEEDGSPYSTLHNDSLTERLIEFGHIMIKKEETIYYQGDAEVGVVINIHAVGNVEMLNIYNVQTREKMSIDTDKLEAMTGKKIVSGDQITISTTRNNKRITLTRSGLQYNILNALNKDADWFTLTKGDNIFTYTANYGANNLQFSIENQILYEGI